MPPDPRQTDIEDYINRARTHYDRARLTSSVREAQLLWRKNIPAVRDTLRNRGFHPGIPGFLPYLDAIHLAKEVQAVQKRCRVGLLDQADVDSFLMEWVRIRSWILQYTDPTYFCLYMWGHTELGRKATTIQLHSDDVQDGTGVAVYRALVPKGFRTYLRATVKAPVIRGGKKISPPHEKYEWMVGTYRMREYK